jgi:hypothetical protein
VNYTGYSDGQLIFTDEAYIEQSITILDDSIIGGGTYFFVNLTGTNATFGSKRNATITIVEDEEALVNHTYNIVAGWNMVSIPLMNSTLYASNLSVFGSINKVCRYNVTSTLFEQYIVGFSPPASNFQLIPDTGYFMNCTAASLSMTLNGTSVSQSRTVYLYSNWNMIGWSINSQMNASAFGALNNKIRKVVKYNSTTLLFDQYIVGFSPPASNFNLTKTVGGYFIYSNTTTMETVNIS